MEELLVIDNQGTVTLSPEARSIPLFTRVWNRDNTETKSLARKELAYVQFMTSFSKSNVFRDYDEDSGEKDKKIRTALLIPESWAPDNAIQDALDFFNGHREKSIAFSYWKANVALANRLKTHLETIEPDERNERGVPIRKERDIIAALNQCSETIKGLLEAQKKVLEEDMSVARKKAGRRSSPLSNPRSVEGL